MWSYMSALLGSPREQLNGLEPRVAAVARELRAPAERVAANVAEDPAQVRAVRAGAFLEDLAVLRAADQLGAISRARVDPRNPPCVDLRVVDPDRHSILIVERSPALGLADIGTVARRRDPYVLDRAVFERALEADLPVVLARRPVGQERLPFGFPATRELAVRHELVHACSLVSRRLLRCQNLALSQRRGRHAERAAEGCAEVA